VISLACFCACDYISELLLQIDTLYVNQNLVDLPVILLSVIALFNYRVTYFIEFSRVLLTYQMLKATFMVQIKSMLKNWYFFCFVLYFFLYITNFSYITCCIHSQNYV